MYKHCDRLQVRTFIKPTNRQLYVCNSSHHPPGTTKGVAFGEAIRYLRTNSEKKQFYKMLFLHKRNLLKRGYPRSLINQTMKKVKFSMREDMLKPKIKTKTKDRSSKRLVFVTRYCQSLQNSTQILAPAALRACQHQQLHQEPVNTGVQIKSEPGQEICQS